MAVPPQIIPELAFRTLVLLLGTACTGVEFFERRELSEPEMLLEQSPCAIHFQQKVVYSTEGAVGGVGTSGGGGCGCY